jgi:hypothetical protein
LLLLLLLFCSPPSSSSDNNICISLRGVNWLTNEWIKKLRMPCYIADGRNIFDIWYWL